MKKKSFLWGRICAFRDASHGVWVLVSTQHASWIHIACAVAACIAGFFLHLNRMEWAWVVVAITINLAAEAINTALENLADATMPEYHRLVGHAKDAAAGAVMITAAGAVVIGILILGPHVLELFQ